ENGVNQSPLNALIMWAISLIPVDFKTHIVLFQLILVSAMMVTAIVLIKLRQWRPLDAAMFALIPLWPFIWFVAEDMISVMFAALSLWFWYWQRSGLSALALGIGAASGAWVLILLVAYGVNQYRREETLTMIKVSSIAIVTPIVLSLPRVFAGQPLINKGDLTAGEGSPLFIWSIITESEPASNAFIALLGLFAIGVVARWASQLPFDFRLEPLIAIFVIIQILTGPTLSPQIFTHLLWVLVLAIPRKSFLLGFSLVSIVYVSSVWLRFEAGVENGKGISLQLYAVISAALWVGLFVTMRRCVRLLTIQGSDEVMQTLSVAMSNPAQSSRIVEVK
ncbi:MAG: hypothetical protein RLZZ508_936, partial [Actinomycetota bacterium]